MAIIKPSSILKENIIQRSNAEYKIYEKIKKLTDNQSSDWIVYYSYTFRRSSLKRDINSLDQEEYEIDYLFVIPNNGVYLVEIKGGKICKEDGVLYSYDKKKKRHVIDPIEQAKTTYFALGKILYINHNIELQKYNYHYIIAFPDMDKIDDLDFGYPSDDIITKNTDLYEFFERMGNKYRKADIGLLPFDNEVANQLNDIFKGKDFKFEIDEKQLIYEINQAIEEKTKESIKFYNQILFENPRALVKGIAGSGKTMLAIDIYKNELKHNRKPLFLVFNKLLCSNLNKLNPDSCHLFYNFINIQYNKYNEPLDENLDFDLKKAKWFEFINQIDFQLDYDTLIIDEAQDIEYQDEIITFLSKCLKGGLDNGSWYFFYDDNQKLYIKKHQMPIYEGMDLSVSRPMKITLNEVIRSSQDISQMIKSYEKYINIDKRIDFEKITRLSSNSYYYHNDDYQQTYQKIIDKISAILDEGIYKKRQITILFDKNESEATKYLLKHYSSNLKEYPYDGPSLTYSTIRRFKGLDNDVIIYVHDGDFSNFFDDYVALTRAKHAFYYFDCAEKSIEYFRYDLKKNCLIDNNYKVEREFSLEYSLKEYDFLAKNSSKMISKAQVILDENRIDELIIDKKQISTIVHGTSDYHVSVLRDGVNVGFKCECKFYDEQPNKPCKHIICLMMKLKNQLN